VAHPGDDNKQEPRDSLLRDLAHELRDALSPVASSIDLLRLRAFEPEVGRIVTERIDRALRRAFSTVDAFVLAEQSENGTLVLEVLACDLNEIVQAARELTAPEVQERCVIVNTSYGVGTKADPRRSAQLVSALLEHAATLAVPGTVLDVEALASDTRPRIRIRCRVDAHLLPGEEWFLSYRAVGGGRIALRTARRIMTLQQGALEVSAPAPGECEFLVIFEPATMSGPGAVAGSAEKSAAPAGATAPARVPTHIMIVDDSADVRRAYREALVPLGYAVTEAADADQALGVLESGAPDVALIDIHLPRMNGYQLAQKVRSRSGATIRLIMLSGMALDPTTLRLSREAGFDDCLDKMAGPLALHKLLQGRAKG
jgi:CheY-like chemotaxis protein